MDNYVRTRIEDCVIRGEIECKFGTVKGKIVHINENNCRVFYGNRNFELRGKTIYNICRQLEIVLGKKVDFWCYKWKIHPSQEYVTLTKLIEDVTKNKKVTLVTVPDIQRATCLLEQNNYRFYVISKVNGYITRKIAGEIKPYSGRYGDGYVIDRPSLDSSRYIWREYYIHE